MGKVMRHTLGASLNIRHNLSSSKGPKPLQLKLLTTYIPKTSACTLAFSTSQRLRTTRASARTLRGTKIGRRRVGNGQLVPGCLPFLARSDLVLSHLVSSGRTRPHPCRRSRVGPMLRLSRHQTVGAAETHRSPPSTDAALGGLVGPSHH